MFKVVNTMSYQLPLTAKIFYLLTLSNVMLYYYLYIFAMLTSLFLDLIVHFDNSITLEDGWLESTPKILVF